jgi:5-hydroxyisourate hydrolase-like protein (transthyretin family)
MVLLQIFAAAALIQFGAQAQSNLASVEGIVLRAGTSEPIGRATVSLIPLASSAVTTLSGRDGRFAFPSVAAGRYRIAITRAGYLDKIYTSEDSGNGTAGLLNVRSGERVQDLQLFMTPAAAISGRIYDPDGNPAANVLVEALKRSYREELLRLVRAGAAQTNDRGEYRLFGLTRGKYYVEAVGITNGLELSPISEAALGVPQKIGSDFATAVDALVPVFFPGTADLEGAQPIDLQAGADLGGVDLTLVQAKKHNVRGTVIDGRTGRPASSATVTMHRRGGGVSGLTGGTESDGRFQVEKVLPGSYVVEAVMRTESGFLTGRLPLQMGDADIENVTAVISPGTDIQGEVVYNGSRRLTDFHPNITLYGVQDGTIESAEFTDSHRFTIHDIAPGDYEIRVHGLQPNEYMKSIHFGGADASNGTVQVRERSTASIEIRFATTTASVDGTIHGASGEPVANLKVTLVPLSEQSKRADLYKTSTSDSSGRFHFQGVAPGDYMIFAWYDVEADIWHDPDLVQQLGIFGTLAHVDENTTLNMEVRPVPTD